MVATSSTSEPPDTGSQRRPGNVNRSCRPGNCASEEAAGLSATLRYRSVTERRSLLASLMNDVSGTIEVGEVGRELGVRVVLAELQRKHVADYLLRLGENAGARKVTAPWPSTIVTVPA